jgi:predicted dehydrogenase
MANVGIIGCGNISPIYFQSGQTFDAIDVVACADLDMDKARARGEEFGARAVTVEQLLGDPNVDIVMNLTIPAAHYEVALQCVRAGKHVHNEKPLCLTREEAATLLSEAEANGVRVGGAPDTFMGGGHQTCRKLIDDGAIGRPTAGAAFMLGHGHETWHPNPEFYYKPGGGPMFDMGPYYLTALVNLLGPIARATGCVNRAFEQRTITSEPRYGETIDVEVPTHVSGLMDFQNGAVVSITTSFDVWAADAPLIQIWGTEGSLICPDPNGFGGEVKLYTAEKGQWETVELTHAYTENSRGIGVADMALAIEEGREQRPNGRLAAHVLDAMHAFHDASAEGRHVPMTFECDRPDALAPDETF